MELHTWWLFVGMTFVVSATPGPNMLLVMRTSARSGFRMALGSMAGCMSSLLLMMSLSAAGLGALLLAFPTVFDTLRLLGAAYLAYLGWSCWRAPVDDAPDRQGALVAASNPKAILFAAAFFPQFIHPSQPELPQFGILLATFSVIEVGWYLVYALSGHSLSHYLQRPQVRRGFNRVTGGAFMGFAALMAGLRS